MKVKISHPEPSDADVVGPKYWKSLDDLADTPDFRNWLEREFPQGAAEMEGVDRRNFLKIMGASFALAGFGLSGCRAPTQHVLPYSKQPERVIPGVPLYYASSLPTGWDNIPLVVETHEARPTKIEGNPSYRGYHGATDIYGQASVLDLYDLDRARWSHTKSERRLSRSAVRDLINEVRGKYSEGGGAGLVFLANCSTSPTRARLVAKLKEEFPQAEWAEYEPIRFDRAEDALERFTGKRVRPVMDFSKAQRVLAVDSDFLHTEAGHLASARGYAEARRVTKADEAASMNRLYAVESNYTVTGASADHRLRLASSQMTAFLAMVAAEVFEQTGGASDLVSLLRGKAQGFEGNPEWIVECVRDLIAHKGGSLVVAGAHLPAEAHVLAFAINSQLGAVGSTVDYLEVPSSGALAITDVAEKIKAGGVKTLVIMGGNPAYDAPGDLGFAELIGSVDQVIRFGYYHDETSHVADYHIAANHYLESWADGLTWDGAYVPVQPVIMPLFEGFAELEFLSAFVAGAKDDPYELVRETFAERLGDGSDLTFETWLAEGVVVDSRFPVANPRLDSAGLSLAVRNAPARQAAPSEANLEFRIIPSSHAWDGRYNNNGWMQECPDPMTKLTWENAILVSPRLAKALGITPQPMVLNELGQANIASSTFKQGKDTAPVAELTVNGKTLRGPVLIQPGLDNYTVVLQLGYGRPNSGRVGSSRDGSGIGFNVYPFTRSDQPGVVTGGKLRILPETYILANTQMHWSMEGRALVREANNTDYEKHPDFVSKMGMEAHSPAIYGADKDLSVAEKALQVPRGGGAYETPAFGDPAPNVKVWNQPGAREKWLEPQQWGMVIDLNTCIGCNACVVACQSENNIPIVGKDQVVRGREMHWIRLDRYFSAGVGPDGKIDTTEIPEDPQVSFQSVACMHCELAPCEVVCPVNATVHDEQGLNVMAYNRCVGTRYCANNCPYKVRRFNFFDWHKREIGEFYKGPFGKEQNQQLAEMQRNPDVTVRMRGVMEKCTYCTQRIEAAKIDQKVKARDSADVRVPDGTIKTACQQVCPTAAITFGDISDSDSEVNKLKENDRDYSVLGYLNIRPRTTYLARLRNPNPSMPGYRDMPLSRIEYETKYGHGH